MRLLFLISISEIWFIDILVFIFLLKHSTLVGVAIQKDIKVYICKVDGGEN